MLAALEELDLESFFINPSGRGRDKLEQFLNSLKGEIVSIIPNVKPTFQGMGATAKVDFLYIVEKMK